MKDVQMGGKEIAVLGDKRNQTEERFKARFA
jgi:hypothetical protein